MSVNNHVTIHECNYDYAVCENYLCRQSVHKKKYYIGVEQGSPHKPVFCEDCIQHLVRNLPANLNEESAELEERLREELEEKFEAEYLEKVRAKELEMAEILDQEKQLLDAQNSVITDVNEVDQSEKATEEDDDETVYRCLDCGEEFETPQGLGSHKRIHKED